jgi:cytoplasmic FMR1 interacting protein
MTSNASLSFDMNQGTISKDPDVLAPSADISYPPAPTFQRLDLPTQVLDIPSTDKSKPPINKEVPLIINHLNVLEKGIDEAKKFIPFLYSYRSIFRATMKPEKVKETIALADSKKFPVTQKEPIPPETPVVPEGQEPPNMEEYNKFREACIFKQEYWKSYKEHFIPTYNQLIELNLLCTDIVKNIKPIMEADSYTPTEVIFEKFISLFSVIYNLDQLKLLKTGLNIDLSNYKRCFAPEDLMKEENSSIRLLPMFLSTPRVTLSYIHDALFLEDDKKTPRQSKALNFLVKLMEYCVFKYKNDVLIPDEKAAVLLTLVSILSFHGTKDIKSPQNIYNASIMPEVFEILSENPVIPLYGDNSLAHGYDLPKSDGYYNNTRFQIPYDQKTISEKTKPQFVVNNMQHFRDLYRDNLRIVSDISRKGIVTEEGLLSLLSCLSEMTYSIQRQSAVKIICVAARPEDQTMAVTGKKELKYDLGVKFNYTSEEKSALVELIGYIKTLAATTIQAEPVIQEYIDRLVYGEVQEYIQNTIERPLVRARQAQDDDAKKLLEVIRDLFGNWRGENPNIGLPEKTKQIKKHEIDPGLIPVSAHQLDILRIQLASLIAENGRFTSRVSMFQFSHFRPKHVNLTNIFLEKARKWYPMLSFVETVKQATNLSFLWLRETFLNVDEEIQYPVRSSLPFILAEHVLNASDKPALHDSTFFPFELYNDAAYAAIYTFNSQYLYREVEAEVELCVDMIAFTFADTFYKFCRATSSTMELPPECIGRITPPPMRYSVMVQQNKMELLGTPIDFNQITTSKLNARLLKELEGYVSSLTDFRLAPYIAHLVRVARTSHALLCDNHLLMDSFEAIWQRARLFDSPLCLDSKLADQIYRALDFSHWRLNCVSRRYLANKQIKINPLSVEQWANEYAKIHKHELEYIGAEHIRSIIELLSPGELSFIIHRITERLEDTITKVIEIYTQVASSIRLLPAISKDDIVGYYTFNSDAYSSISHPQLRTFFDGMRTLGNTLVFLWYLENELPASEKSSSIMSPVMKTLTQILIDKRELFFSDGSLNLESVITHRSFPSLWSVLEFIICSPDPIKLKEGDDPVIPLEYLGDGPVIAAHVFITLCNQSSLYKFDSMCFRTLELLHAEQSNIPNDTLSRFLFNAAVADQCRKFAELIATPFQAKFEEN